MTHPSVATPSPFSPLTTAEQMLAVAAAQGHVLTAPNDACDETGLDSLVCHAIDAHGTPWILRAPRRADVAERMRVEAAILTLVTGRVGVRVPAWEILATSLNGYRRLAGTPVVTVSAEGPVFHGIDLAAPPERLLRELGAVLAALQAIDAGEEAANDVPRTPIADERRALVHAMDAMRPVLQPTDALWARWQRFIGNDALWPPHTALVHGDLHAGHWLLDEHTHLVGILDWTEARFANPATDFAMLAGHFGREHLETIVQAFAQSGGHTWPALVDHATELWAALPAIHAEWALRVGKEDMVGYIKAQLLTE